LTPLDNWYDQQEEPARGCFHFLRQFILDKDPAITEAWKYSMPFFCYQGKMFVYLWFHKEYQQPYIGFVDGGKINHPELLQEKRARMKIFLVDVKKDIPIKKLNSIFKEVLQLRKQKK
jgi:hypothetical protein